MLNLIPQKGSASQTHENIRLQAYENIISQGYENIRVQEYENIRSQAYENIMVQEYENIWVQTNIASFVNGQYTDPQLDGHCVALVTVVLNPDLDMYLNISAFMWLNVVN